MRRAWLGILLGAAVVTAASAWTTTSTAAESRLPARLSDQEFWRLSTSFSEAGGTFHSDNFVSNEGQFQTVIPELIRRVPRGGFYVGVGPEQNFTYLAAIRPRMAFIVDIRRGNLHEHLLYKALFEMSADRAEFVSRLFSRPRPATLTATSTVDAIFDAVGAAAPTEALYRQNLAAVTAWLTRKHGWSLSAEDLAGIAYVYRTAFFTNGPGLNYQLAGAGRSLGLGVGTPSYAQLMTMDDGAGRKRGYLASEAGFAYLKALESGNLLVPVVGDFGGPKALRAVGTYARQHDATIAAFYVSNVEQYLAQDGKLDAFCQTVTSMPLDRASTFIRSVRGAGGQRRGGGFSMFTSSLESIVDQTRPCVTAEARQ